MTIFCHQQYYSGARGPSAIIRFPGEWNYKVRFSYRRGRASLNVHNSQMLKEYFLCHPLMAFFQPYECQGQPSKAEDRSFLPSVPFPLAVWYQCSTSIMSTSLTVLVLPDYNACCSAFAPGIMMLNVRGCQCSLAMSWKGMNPLNVSSFSWPCP